MSGHATRAGDGHQLDLAPTGGCDPGLARWARYGVDHRESMLYVADHDTADVAALVAALATNGVDATVDAIDGRLVVVEPDRFYGGGFEKLIEHASVGGRHAVRTFGGPRLAAQVLTGEQFEDFERQLASSWRAHRVTSVCRYDERDLADADDFTHAFARHHSGWGGPQFHAHRPRPGLLVLDGEADLANAPVMGAVFAEALRDAGPLLMVDCAALRFASVGAWRAAAAPVQRSHGTRVQLIRTVALTRRLLAVLGLDATFEVADEP